MISSFGDSFEASGQYHGNDMAMIRQSTSLLPLPPSIDAAIDRRLPCGRPLINCAAVGRFFTVGESQFLGRSNDGKLAGGFKYFVFSPRILGK